MNHAIKAPNRIVRSVIDGSLAIDSVTEFENLFRVFQDEPGLHRVYADFLVGERSFEAAADEYAASAELFVEAGMPLQAIACKVSEWGILKPSPQEEEAFYSGLRGNGSQEPGLQQFLTKMTNPELSAFVRKLVINRFPARSKVKRLGDEEGDLCFVVHGTLEKSTYGRSGEGGKLRIESKTTLLENDFFGEIVPFVEDRASAVEVETATYVEVAKIPKADLKLLFQEHPNIEDLLFDLSVVTGESDSKKPPVMMRKEVRHEMPTQVSIKVLQQGPQKASLNLEGFTEDLSLGGACIVLGEKYRTGEPGALIGRDVKVHMALPIVSTEVSVLGTIVWSKALALEAATKTVVGIKFKDVTERDREVLRNFCRGSDGEQNLIWSLWESLVQNHRLP
jgi:CRP-like cAMP-binding protein